METLALFSALALPWLLGIAVLFALDWPRNETAGSALALRAGFGYMIGAILLTLWMRMLSFAGLAFGWLSIAVPLAAVTAALTLYAVRAQRSSIAGARNALKSLVSPGLPPLQHVLWLAILAWLAIRFALLAGEIGWRPLYPWNAWVQWATKARVWYELGRMVPFVDATTWLAGAPGAYFDASPNDPATAPLLQVWSCIAIGHWDDSAMNWPWLAMLVSLTIAAYGVLRGERAAPLVALLGAYIVASLPLLDVHVALAGYADLPMGVVFTLAALATYRWCLRRDERDGAVALFLALACPLITNLGAVWALMLIPGVAVALMPRRGMRVLGIGAVLGVLALLVLVRAGPMIGYPLHPNFAPMWSELFRNYFFLGNWNLLWYALVVISVIGARRLLEPPLAPLTAIAAAGLAFLFLVFAVNDAPTWLTHLTTTSRTTLHIAPLLVVLGTLAWNQLAAPAPAQIASAAAAGTA